MQEIQKNGVYCQTDRTDDRRSGYHFFELSGGKYGDTETVSGV